MASEEIHVYSRTFYFALAQGNEEFGAFLREEAERRAENSGRPVLYPDCPSSVDRPQPPPVLRQPAQAPIATATAVDAAAEARRQIERGLRDAAWKEDEKLGRALMRKRCADAVDARWQPAKRACNVPSLGSFAKDALEQAYTLRGEALQLDERVRHIEHKSPFEQNSELCRIDPRRPAVE
jgi:hypothetical protein